MLRTISADAALGELRANGVIADARIDEPLSLRPLCDGDTLNWPVSIVRCSLKELDASCVEFAAPVVFERCQIEKAQLFAAYFLAGLVVRSCVFTDAVDFQCGGHNRGAALVSLEDNLFDGFVNFFDCWYEGPFEVRRCTFRKGTNLFGNKGEPFEVRFDVEPVVTETMGVIDQDGKGAA